MQLNHGQTTSGRRHRVLPESARTRRRTRNRPKNSRYCPRWTSPPHHSSPRPGSRHRDRGHRTPNRASRKSGQPVARSQPLASLNEVRPSTNLPLLRKCLPGCRPIFWNVAPTYAKPKIFLSPTGRHRAHLQRGPLARQRAYRRGPTEGSFGCVSEVDPHGFPRSIRLVDRLSQNV